MSDVRDDPAKGRFEMASGDAVAFVEYTRAGDRIVLTHTEVPEAMSGQGVGSKLMRGTLDALRGSGVKVVPRCEFVAAYIERHPEYRYRRTRPEGVRHGHHRHLRSREGAVLSRTHEDQFDAAYAEAVDPCDAIVTLQDWLRVRVRDPLQDGLLLLGLPGDLGQRCRVRPGLYVLPPGHWPEFRDAIDLLGIRASVVACVCMRLELRHRGALDALRAALLRRAPTFGPTYPRITAV